MNFLSKNKSLFVNIFLYNLVVLVILVLTVKYLFFLEIQILISYLALIFVFVIPLIFVLIVQLRSLKKQYQFKEEHFDFLLKFLYFYKKALTSFYLVFSLTIILSLSVLYAKGIDLVPAINLVLQLSLYYVFLNFFFIDSLVNSLKVRTQSVLEKQNIRYKSLLVIFILNILFFSFFSFFLKNSLGIDPIYFIDVAALLMNILVPFILTYIAFSYKQNLFLNFPRFVEIYKTNIIKSFIFSFVLFGILTVSVINDISGWGINTSFLELSVFYSIIQYFLILEPLSVFIKNNSANS